MGARGLAEMAQDKRILVAKAARFLGKPRGKRLINQAWKQRFITLYGVPAGESEPVEIPHEGGTVDCKKSRIVIGRLGTTHLSVTMEWSDVKRLAQADVDWLLREAEAAAPQDDGRAPVAQEAGGKLTAFLPPLIGTSKEVKIAKWLRYIYGPERPGKTLTEMEDDVCETVREAARKPAGKDLGVFKRPTFKRGVKLA